MTSPIAAFIDVVTAGVCNGMNLTMQVAASGHSAHVGLTTVDHRLARAFRQRLRQVVETAIGAGTKIVMPVV